jgi:hypothetical protein
VERFNEFAVQNEMSANGQERTLKPRLSLTKTRDIARVRHSGNAIC